MASYVSVRDLKRISAYRRWVESRRNRRSVLITTGLIIELIALALVVFYLAFVKIELSNLVWSMFLAPCAIAMFAGVGVIFLVSAYYMKQQGRPTWAIRGEVVSEKQVDQTSWKKSDKKQHRTVRLADGSYVDCKLVVPAKHFANEGSSVIAFGWYNNSSDVWAVPDNSDRTTYIYGGSSKSTNPAGVIHLSMYPPDIAKKAAKPRPSVKNKKRLRGVNDR